jgi:hypothetical protein
VAEDRAVLHQPVAQEHLLAGEDVLAGEEHPPGRISDPRRDRRRVDRRAIRQVQQDGETDQHHQDCRLNPAIRNDQSTPAERIHRRAHPVPCPGAWDPRLISLRAIPKQSSRRRQGLIALSRLRSCRVHWLDQVTNFLLTPAAFRQLTVSTPMLAVDVEGSRRIGSADAEEDGHGLAYVRAERFLAALGAHTDITRPRQAGSRRARKPDQLHISAADMEHVGRESRGQSISRVRSCSEYRMMRLLRFSGIGPSNLQADARARSPANEHRAPAVIKAFQHLADHPPSGVRVALNKFWLSQRQWAVIEL